MAREGVENLGAGAGRRATSIGAFPPVVGIFCAPARPRGGPGTMAGRFLRLKRLYWCISYVICATWIPSYARPPKPQPIRTGLPPPRWLAICTTCKSVAAPKNPATGLRVTLSAISAKNNENKRGTGAVLDRAHAQVHTATHRHLPRMRSITGVLLTPREPAFVRGNPPNRAAQRLLKAPRSTLP